ncbi:unnamed protein product, partial [Meganyctiphanes norvegica]
MGIIGDLNDSTLDSFPTHHQVNMNALKVITLAAVAACGSTSPIYYNGLNYNHGIHSYNGLHGYTGLNGYAAAPVAYSSAAAAPVAYSPAAAPAYNTYVAPYAAYNNYAAPYAPIQTQYHSQDELGQYSFGYSGGPSNRAETRDAYGNVRGSYSYIDSNGQTQTQHYVADALGFRVSGTNLPVGPDAPAVLALAGPEPVQDTPEVAAAKEEFLALYNEAAAAAAAAPDTRKKRSVGSVAVHSAVAPLAYSGIHHGHHGLIANNGLLGHHGLIGHHAGIAVAAASPAAVHDAELLRVENNPGHAVSYRVLN